MTLTEQKTATNLKTTAQISLILFIYLLIYLNCSQLHTSNRVWSVKYTALVVDMERRKSRGSPM